MLNRFTLQAERGITLCRQLSKSTQLTVGRYKRAKLSDQLVVAFNYHLSQLQKEIEALNEEEVSLKQSKETMKVFEGLPVPEIKLEQVGIDLSRIAQGASFLALFYDQLRLIAHIAGTLIAKHQTSSAISDSVPVRRADGNTCLVAIESANHHSRNATQDFVDLVNTLADTAQKDFGHTIQAEELTDFMVNYRAIIEPVAVSSPTDIAIEVEIAKRRWLSDGVLAELLMFTAQSQICLAASASAFRLGHEMAGENDMSVYYKRLTKSVDSIQENLNKYAALFSTCEVLFYVAERLSKAFSALDEPEIANLLDKIANLR